MSLNSLGIRISFILLSASLLFTSACKKNRHKVDVSNIEINMNLQRFETEIFNVKTLDDYLALDQKDPVFFEAYKQHIIGDITGARFNVDTLAQYRGFSEFINNSDMQDLYNKCMTVFKDMEPHKKAIEQAFRYYRYHFPDKNVPDIITYVAPFRYGAISMENRLCIELDMFLGSDFEPYWTPSLNFPGFIIKKLKPDMLVPNAMKAWLVSEFPKDDADDRFIAEIIYEGKILYLMDAVFPEMPDSLKIGYVNGQIEWNRQNEAQIWENIVNNDLLYSTDEMEYMGMIHDGPFSKGVNVPQESSPRIGVWTGWQIVKHYMDRNRETTLEELMAMDDPARILKGSRYKP